MWKATVIAYITHYYEAVNCHSTIDEEIDRILNHHAQDQEEEEGEADIDDEVKAVPDPEEEEIHQKIKIENGTQFDVYQSLELIKRFATNRDLGGIPNKIDVLKRDIKIGLLKKKMESSNANPSIRSFCSMAKDPTN